MLEIRKTGETQLGVNSGFDFRIFDEPSLVEAAIREKVTDGLSAHGGRLLLALVASER